MADRSVVPAGPDRAGPRRPGGREALAWAGLVAALAGGLLWWAWPSKPRETRSQARRGGPIRPSDFIGSSSCGECHPGESAAHANSGHARTLRPAASLELAAWLDGRSFPDPEQPDVQWSYRNADGRLTATRERDGAEDGSWLLDWALGSGKHAVTFVSLDDRRPRTGLEHRLTYFAHRETMGLTPGQARGPNKPGLTDHGYNLTPAILADCFGCHATRTSAAGPLTVDPATLLPNVSCERCHGPARAHVEAARRGTTDPWALAMPYGPGRGTPAGELELCGRCHRLPGMVDPRTIKPENRAIARFPSVGLVQSECHAKTPGGLSCTTCHDPHARTSKDAARYERACLRCHDAPQASSSCPVQPSSGCVGCHMPRRDVGHGLEFTDHWIRRPPGM